MRYFSLSLVVAASILLGSVASVHAATLFREDFNTFTPAAATPGNFAGGTPNGWTVAPGSGTFYSANASPTFNIGNVTNYGSLLLIQDSGGVTTSTITSPAFTSGAGTFTITVSAATRSTNAYDLNQEIFYGGTGTINVLLDGTPTTISQAFTNPIGTNTGFATYTATATVTAGSHTVALQWVAPKATINGHAVSDNTSGFDFVQVDGPVVPPPTPTVTAISPAKGSTVGGTSVIITGANFTGATATTIGDMAVTTFTVNSATQITATTAAHAAGLVDVVVTTPSGSGTGAQLYTYVTPPPTLTGGTAAISATAGGSAVAIDPSLTVTGSNPLTTASVSITGNFDTTEDVLLFTSQNGIAGSYNSTTGILTLSGSASTANYQAALRSVQYQNSDASAPTLAARTATFSIAPGAFFPATGHFYEFVSAPGISWTDAKAAAAARNIFGLQGYLATLRSAGENTFAFSKVGAQAAWIGASDDPAQTGSVEGDWQWVTGPDKGVKFWSGLANGTPVGGEFNSWNAGEPNNAGGSENFAQFLASGLWNDLPNTFNGINTTIQGYAVEYGGSEGDPTLMLTSQTTINIVKLVPTQIAKNSGDNQTAQVNTNVAIAPSVIVKDSQGIPVPGATVNFVVAAGGGSVSGATATSDASGIATVGSWRLGTLAGANNNTLTATLMTSNPNPNPGIRGGAQPVTTVTFTASATAGPAADIFINDGNNQTAPINTSVPIAPSVLVKDSFGNLVTGATVTYTVASGGGAVTGNTPASDGNGVARVGSWQLGPTAGTNTLTATLGGGKALPRSASTSVTFTATAVNASKDLNGDGIFTPVDFDTDGDGFPDYIETALGTNPNSSESFPFPLKDPLGVKFRAQVIMLLNRTAPGNDKIVVNGSLHLFKGQVIPGSKLTMDVGGNLQQFTLDDKFRGSTENATFRFFLRRNDLALVSDQEARFQATFNKGAFFANILTNSYENIRPAARAETPTIPDHVVVTIVYNNFVLRAIIPLRFRTLGSGAIKTKGVNSNAGVKFTPAP